MIPSAFMRHNGSRWEIGPRPWRQAIHRGFFFAGLISLLATLIHWASWGPFYDEHTVVFGIAGGIFGLLAAAVAHYLYTMTPKVVVDTDAREFVADGVRVPFAMAGPVALWQTWVRVDGGVHGTDSMMQTWMAAIICGGPAARAALLEERNARRKSDPEDRSDITVELDKCAVVPITAGTQDVHSLRLAAGDLARLWNNQVINTRGGNEPDLSSFQITIRATLADIDALDAPPEAHRDDDWWNANPRDPTEQVADNDDDDGPELPRGHSHIANPYWV